MTGFQSPHNLPSRMWTQSKEDSEILAQRIRGYWAARGYEVRTAVHTLVELGDVQPSVGTVWCVRSNMENGFPPRDKNAPIVSRYGSVPVPVENKPAVHPLVRA